MKILYTLSILLLSCLPKNGYCTTSGSELLIYCNDAISIIDTKSRPSLTEVKGLGMCFGLIEGVLNSVLGLESHLPQDRRICVQSESIKLQQLIRIFVKYVKDNPKYLHENGTILVYASLVNAFPCPPSIKQKGDKK